MQLEGHNDVFQSEECTLFYFDSCGFLIEYDSRNKIEHGYDGDD
jgi:hypothetical protein